jgi:3',5'-cyclic AMP phosphodiesterase CpdA
MDFSQPTRTFVVLACLIGIGLAAAPAASAVKVAAAGDVSCPADSTRQNAIQPGQPEPAPGAAKCQGKRVARMIKDQDPDIVLALGDLIQGQSSEPGAYNDFRLAWGELSDRVASSVGNHDYYVNDDGVRTAAGYFDYWEKQKVPAWRFGKPDRGWSSWNTGDWHMVNLNSNCNVADCTFTGRQLRWLIRDLRENRKEGRTKCTLAYFHHPLFSSGAPRGRSGDASLVANLWEILYRFRTDLVLTGHQHFYERYLPQNPSGKRDATGITQVISGTGGASTFRPEGEKGIIAPNAAFSIRRLGATFLDLGPGTYSSHFRDMLGKQFDPVAPRSCLKPGAGHDRRVPRVKRYEKHMKRMSALNRRVKKLNRRIRAARKKNAAESRIEALKDTRRGVVKKRGRVRNDRLY